MQAWQHRPLRVIRRLMLIALLTLLTGQSTPPVASADSPFTLDVWDTTREATDNARGGSVFGFSMGGAFLHLPKAEIERRLDGVKQVGGQWVRVGATWSSIQADDARHFGWNEVDRVVEAAHARDLNVLLVILGTPRWARVSGCQGTPEAPAYFCAPRNVQDYATFAAAVVQHYSPLGVKYYELWNEPNSWRFWKPLPDAAQYTALLQAAYPAMKREDSSIIVITGGLAPAADVEGMIAPLTFLKRVYDNGGRGYFDAVGHHPYTFPSFPGETQPWNAWRQMSGAPESLRTMMESHGDGRKRIWATEFGAPTEGSKAVTEEAQARMITEAYRLWSSYAWAGPLFTYTYYDDENTGFGLVRRDWTPKPAWYAYQAATRTRRLPRPAP